MQEGKPANQGAEAHGTVPRLRALLAHPRMAGVQVENGEDSPAEIDVLGALVARINLVEVFDDFAKVFPGDFVLTTGYAWEQYCGDGAGVVAAVQERGAVCLAFQEDIYQPQLPVSLREAARKRCFPLLLLPKHFTFRLVSQAWAEAGQAGEAGEQISKEKNLAAAGELPEDARALIAQWHREAAAWVAGQEVLTAAFGLSDWEAVQQTLIAFLALGGNHAATAARLGVHRHTVRNRLRQFARLTGLDLADQSTRLLLELALLPDQELNQEQKSAATKA